MKSKIVQIHWKFIAKSRFRRREGSAGRRRVGGAEIGWFGGCQNPCHFLINSVSESGHFGPPEGPRHISGVFGPAQPRPARRVPRAPPRDRRAERRSRARSLQRRSRVRRPEVALGIASSIARREFGFSNRPRRRRTTNFVLERSLSRLPFRNPTFQSHKRAEIRLGILQVDFGISKATSGHRPRTTYL